MTKRFLPLLLFPLLTVANADDIRVLVTTASKGIYQTILDTETNRLSKATQLTDTTGTSFATLSPDKTHLYTCAKGGVSAFKIESDALTELNHQPWPEGKGFCYVALDATGKTLLAADYGAGKVASYRIQEDGKIGPLVSHHTHQGSGPHRRQKSPHAHCIVPGPDNNFAYAADLGTDEIFYYRIDHKTSALSPAGKVKLAPGAGPRHLKFGPNGRFAYVLNELDLTVTTLQRKGGGNGALAVRGSTKVYTESNSEGMTASEIVLTKDGKRAYAAIRDTAGTNRDHITMLTIENDGKTAAPYGAHLGVKIPRNIALTPNGSHLLTAARKSGRLSVSTLKPDGHFGICNFGTGIPAPMCILFP